MKSELDGLALLLDGAKIEKKGSIEFICGNLYGKEIVGAVCGVGKVFAAICAQTMILEYKPDIIINTGVAGTLTEKLSVGDIAISESVVQHDMDTSPLGDPIGMISGINIVHIPSDKDVYFRLAEIAQKCGFKFELGTIASGDVFVANGELKKKISTLFGAIACEMEGAAVGQVCYVNSVPFAVIRAISDGGDEDAGMSFEKFVAFAAERSRKLLTEYIRTL